jgi:hypothetical protein
MRKINTEMSSEDWINVTLKRFYETKRHFIRQINFGFELSRA